MTHLPLRSFYFMRHGETDWNKKQVYMGQQDIPLNNIGRDQARYAYDMLKENRIDHIATSPLARALETTHIINEKLNYPITVIDELKECCFGVKEGTPHDNGEFIQQWINGECIIGAESSVEFESRILKGMQKALQCGNRVLIVSHGGVYAALSKLMGWPIIDLNNCEPVLHGAMIQSEILRIG